MAQQDQKPAQINRAIIVRPRLDNGRYSNALFEVRFQFPNDDAGQQIDLKVMEVTIKDKDEQESPLKVKEKDKDVEVSFKGKLDQEEDYLLRFSPANSSLLHPEDDQKDVPETPHFRLDLHREDWKLLYVMLPDGKARKLRLVTEVGNPKVTVKSPIFSVANYFTLPMGSVATYDWYGGNTARFYSNASEGKKGDEKDAQGNTGAYFDIKAAIDQAEHFIFIADWSFHPYVLLTRDKDKPAREDTLGAQLITRADKAPKDNKMLIAIHTWDHADFFAPDRPNDYGDRALDYIAADLRLGKKVDTSFRRPDKILWRASSHVGTGLSHHQKFVVLDCKSDDPDEKRREIKVFFGGLDLTQGRFDWWQHPIMPPDKDNKDDEAAGFTKGATGDLYEPAGGALGKGTGAFDTKFNYLYNDWYNGEFGGALDKPREPWHDIHAQLTGPAAWDVVREFVARWNIDVAVPASLGSTSSEDKEKLIEKFCTLFDSKKFVQQWEPRKTGDKGSWIAQVYHSMDKRHWGPPKEGKWWPSTITVPTLAPQTEFEWILGGKYATYEASIQEAYVKAISQANHFIYIESQYFIGGWGQKGPKNQIPNTIVSKILEKIKKDEKFHVYIVLPMYPEGKPDDGGIQLVREYEWKTMRYIILSVYEALVAAKKNGDDWKKYISFYFPTRWEGVQWKSYGNRNDNVVKNKRYMIYVHSKMMIIDDAYIIIGSANLNERSLAGNRDSEICLGLTPEDDKSKDKIKEFRKKLWGELLGNQKKRLAVDSKWDTPETDACRDSIQSRAIASYKAMRKGELKENDHGFLCMWDFKVTGATKDKRDVEINSYDTVLDWAVIPDAPNEGTSRWVSNVWEWRAPGWGFTSKKQVARATTAAE